MADRPVPTVFELHGYQEDFLRRAAAAQGLPDAAAALQKLVGFAMKEEVVKAAIFDDGFNCVHCDSKSPPDWIQNNKGTKHPQLLALTPAALGFLGQEMLLEVGPPGPDKAVIPGELHADHLKAARCCIDWAIAEFGGELVWFQMHGYQHDFLGQMATMQVRGARTATACAVLGPWCWPCRQSAHSRGDVLCVWVQSLAGPAAALQKIVNLAMTDPVRPTALSMPASSTIAPPRRATGYTCCNAPAFVCRLGRAQAVKAAIFDETFHCVHCDSKTPPDWIQTNKAVYTPCALALTPIACAFLGQEMLLEVGPPGPDKAVIPGELHADANKAARCCVDWAIKEFNSKGEALGFHTSARL